MDSVDQGYDDNRFTNVVDDDLHCPICLNILRDPLQCRTNEHHFCKSCITRHLKTFQTCPSCKDKLTFKTLRKPARYLTKSLSKLEIRCDYESRGCHEVIQLENIGTHVKNCEYAPVTCSNDGCGEIMNKRDHMHHESLVCKFRKTKCPDCNALKKEVDDLKGRFNELNDRMHSMMAEMKEMSNIERATRTRLPQTSSDVRQDIIIAGGYRMAGAIRDAQIVMSLGIKLPEPRLKTVEKFSWLKKKWQFISPMKEEREAASAVVFGNLVIVTGGYEHVNKETDTIEAMNMRPESEDIKWFDFPVKLPMKSQGHRSLVYGDRLIVTGGFMAEVNASDAINEVGLTHPFSSNLVCRMPQPRSFHAAVVVDESIAIAGGQTTGNDRDCIASVLLYDVNKQTLKTLAPLPFPVTNMAAVGWRSSMILIGGTNEQLNSLSNVVQYDIKKEESKMMPPMKYKRQGCTAVVTGNVLVVMGGYNEEQGFLNTAECFDFETNSWEELPCMNVRRLYGTAVVQR